MDPQRGLGGQKEADDLQISQQTHFDWYASNDTQSYSEYERTPFWVAADMIAFDTWRSSFKVMDLDIHVIGIDVSKQLVCQALDATAGRNTGHRRHSSPSMRTACRSWMGR